MKERKMGRVAKEGRKGSRNKGKEVEKLGQVTGKFRQGTIRQKGRHVGR